MREDPDHRKLVPEEELAEPERQRVERHQGKVQQRCGLLDFGWGQLLGQLGVRWKQKGGSGIDATMPMSLHRTMEFADTYSHIEQKQRELEGAEGGGGGCGTRCVELKTDESIGHDSFASNAERARVPGTSRLSAFVQAPYRHPLTAIQLEVDLANSFQVFIAALCVVFGEFT